MGRDIRSDHDQLAVAVRAEQQHLDRVAEIIVIELLVLDAVKLYRGFRRHHEIECRAERPSVAERRRQPARRDRKLALIGRAYEAARLGRLELEERPDLLGRHGVRHRLRWVGQGCCFGGRVRRGANGQRARERRGAGKRCSREKIPAANGVPPLGALRYAPSPTRIGRSVAPAPGAGQTGTFGKTAKWFPLPITAQTRPAPKRSCGIHGACFTVRPKKDMGTEPCGGY